MIYVYPTDTVWGIGAHCFDEEACQRVHEIKGTELHKPTSLLFFSLKQILKWFDLPQSMNEEWLGAFFQCETTLGISLERSRIEIPQWITAKSSWVGVRCPQLLWREGIGENQFPMTTTSLNLKGEDPILTSKEAKSFFSKHCSEALFIDGDQGELRGRGSSIFLWTEEGSFSVIRKGELFNKALDVTRILST